MNVINDLVQIEGGYLVSLRDAHIQYDMDNVACLTATGCELWASTGNYVSDVYIADIYINKGIQ